VDTNNPGIFDSKLPKHPKFSIPIPKKGIQYWDKHQDFEPC